MKLFFTGTILLICSLICKGQKNNTDTLKYGDKVFYKGAQIEAKFPGGEAEWQEYVNRNFKITEVLKQMPRKEVEYKETAKVQFVVKTDGSLTDIKIENQVSLPLQKEVIRLVLESPFWIPAENFGEKVNMYKRIQISISIPAQ